MPSKLLAKYEFCMTKELQDIMYFHIICDNLTQLRLIGLMEPVSSKYGHCPHSVNSVVLTQCMQVKTNELLRYHCGCYGNIVTKATE